MLLFPYIRCIKKLKIRVRGEICLHNLNDCCSLSSNIDLHYVRCCAANILSSKSVTITGCCAFTKSTYL